LFFCRKIWEEEKRKGAFRSAIEKLGTLLKKPKKVNILVLGPKGSGKTTVCLRLTGSKSRVPSCYEETQGVCRNPSTQYMLASHGYKVKFAAPRSWLNNNRRPNYLYHFTLQRIQEEAVDKEESRLEKR
jgi:GTPase SAR1 family protein